MPQVSANDITIEYESFGEPSNPTLLLIMGLGMQLIAWPEQFCVELASRGYRVIRYDNRDAGFSTKFEGVKAPSVASLIFRSVLRLPIRVPYTLQDMADDAAGLLDALDVESAHIVGASMGGMIAQNLAASHPRRVRSLTSVMSTSGHRSLPGADPLVTRHVFRTRPTGNDREAVIAHNMRTVELLGSPAYPVDADTRREMVSISFDRCYFPSGFSRHVAAIVKDGDRRSRLGTITAPTLVIHGREDPLVPLAGGIDTANHIPGARLEIIDGMGHNFPVELWPQIIGLITDHAVQADTQ
ncbi:MAG: alpha/beta fold hydrolase [Gammaproteobacteria bacterium]|nr:alpha/beta fold hydrolase [Gammaproteobacteria bacterium]MBT8110975.1 alpha/beta fold hydrolase [Gammaproteobacteria bacterium]NND48138.1 alpha/beta fold hydrolase [Woeseiaceae bacterium]NNL45673.1 alpha/beta fold hydrolase [Woeseiaceae bacterium]